MDEIRDKEHLLALKGMLLYIYLFVTNTRLYVGTMTIYYLMTVKVSVKLALFSAFPLSLFIICY